MFPRKIYGYVVAHTSIRPSRFSKTIISVLFCSSEEYLKKLHQLLTTYNKYKMWGTVRLAFRRCAIMRQLEYDRWCIVASGHNGVELRRRVVNDAGMPVTDHDTMRQQHLSFCAQAAANRRRFLAPKPNFSAPPYCNVSNTLRKLRPSLLANKNTLIPGPYHNGCSRFGFHARERL